VNFDEMQEQLWDVVIIGGGPGGLSAALYTSRSKLSTLVIEKEFIGGLIALTHEVENYPAVEKASGMELTQVIERQAKGFGTEFLFKAVDKLRRGDEDSTFVLDIEGGGTIRALAVIIAAGATPRRLPAPGEQDYYGKGVSYCATCDGAFFRDKNIIVVGGGESAFQEGTFLTQYGKMVTMVHRREGFRATKTAIERARKKENWGEKLNYVVEEIYGEGMVKGVKLKNTQTGEIEDMPVDGVFGFIGYEPASGFCKDLVEVDEEDYIIADFNLRTSVPGVWAIGDIVKGAKKQMVISAGHGATAAMDAREYVGELKG
jgi:thioredoxin reductase (NADPH)